MGPTHPDTFLSMKIMGYKSSAPGTVLNTGVTKKGTHSPCLQWAFILMGTLGCGSGPNLLHPLPLTYSEHLEGKKEGRNKYFLSAYCVLGTVSQSPKDSSLKFSSLLCEMKGLWSICQNHKGRNSAGGTREDWHTNVACQWAVILSNCCGKQRGRMQETPLNSFYP